MKNYFLPLTVVLSFGFYSTSNAQIKEEETVKEAIQVVEDPAEYPGGNTAMMEFLSKNVVYPTAAREKGVQGTVYIQFIILEDGRIDHSNIKVLRGIGSGCDESAISAVKKMPRWKPAYKEGKAVRSMYTIPIKFKMQ